MDPIVKREYLPGPKVFVILWYANYKLLGDSDTSGLATTNPQVTQQTTSVWFMGRSFIY